MRTQEETKTKRGLVLVSLLTKHLLDVVRKLEQLERLHGRLAVTPAATARSAARHSFGRRERRRVGGGLRGSRDGGGLRSAFGGVVWFDVAVQHVSCWFLPSAAYLYNRPESCQQRAYKIYLKNMQ